MSKTLWVLLTMTSVWLQNQPTFPADQTQNERVSSIEAMSSRGNTYFRQNKLDSAALYLDSANTLINAYDIRDTTIVQETKNTYGIVLAYLQRNAESIKVFEELNAFYLKIGDDPDMHTKRGKVFNNIAINYNYLADYEQAIRYFDSCLVIFNERSLLKDRQTQTLYLNKALNQLDLGDYQSALENIELSRHIRSQQTPDEHDRYALMREHLIYGEVLIEINKQESDLRDAISRLQEGLSILTAINPNDYYIGAFLGLLSKAHFLLSEYDDASNYAVQTRNFYINSYGENYTGLIFRNNEYAKILAAQGKIDSAHHYLAQGLTIPVHADANKTMYQVQALLQMAALQGTDSIPPLLARATAILFPGYDGTATAIPPVELIPSHPYMGAFFAKKGELLYRLYRETDQLDYLKQALSCYTTAIREGGRTRKGMMTLRSKATYSNLSQDNFSHAMALAHLLYGKTGSDADFEKILWISDQSKSAILKEHLATGNAAAVGIPENLRIEELELKSKIIQLEQAIYSRSAANQTKPNPEAGDVMGELVEAKLDFDRWLHRLDETYPNYRQLMYQTPYTAPVDSRLILAQRSLSGKVVIDYYEGEDSFYVQYSAKEGSGAFSAAKSNKLMDAILQVRKTITSNTVNSEYQFAAKIVSDHLLSPVLKVTSSKNIVIVPDGILTHIPFEALVDTIDTSAQNYKAYAYLIYKYRFSYLNGLTPLAQTQHAYASARSKIPSVFAMAPSYDGQSQLSQLPNSATEIELIREVLPGQFLHGASATESRLKQLTERPTIIHVAAHAIVDNRNPMNSHLLLAADSINDGRLHTYELFSMKLDTDLICLSACNSGFGEFQKGEGMMSLARGFMYASVPNVLMSLWAVPDKATSDIMHTFYAEIDKGASYADGLHQAKLAYLKQADEHLSNPFYWASFVYMGDPAGEDSTTSAWWWVLGILAIGSLICVAVAKRDVIFIGRP